MDRPFTVNYSVLDTRSFAWKGKFKLSHYRVLPICALCLSRVKPDLRPYLLVLTLFCYFSVVNIE